jgi:pilus assembly protein CpaB
MGAIRLVLVLLVAAISAIVLALVVRNMTSSRPTKAAAVAAKAAPPTVRVLVAKHDMKVGDRLAVEDVAWQPWPANAVNPAFVSGGPTQVDIAAKAEAALQAATGSDPQIQSLTGSLVREPLLANEPVNKRKLVKGGEGGFMAVKLPQGMRAMSLPVTVESGAGGFVLPGDHVDVVQNVKLSNTAPGRGPAQSVETHTVMSNVQVLAIDQTAEPKPGATSLVGAVATLAVPAEDVDALAKAKDEGALLLVLRSYADMAGPAERAKAPAPPRLTQPKVRAVAMRVYSGDKIEQVQVP